MVITVAHRRGDDVSEHPTDNDRVEDALDELDTETVEDLDADESEAEDIRGGTTWHCMPGHHA
jgi:hypothetical protein